MTNQRPDRVLDDSRACLAGGGEMGERTRLFDWSKTALGPVAAWPQSLRSALSICLNSSLPIAIYWGCDHTLLYNDAWSLVLGSKHPWALGRPAREVWSEIWHIIEPLFAPVLSAGEATRSRDQLQPIDRHGFTAECYFDYTFSPIRGESGAIHGVFCAALETTHRVIGARRLRTLRELAAWLPSRNESEADACRTAARILEGNPHDLPFALIYLLDERGQAVLAGETRLEKGTSASLITFDLDGPDTPWPFRTVIQTGKAVEVANLAESIGPVKQTFQPAASPLENGILSTEIPLMACSNACPAGPAPGGAWPEPSQRAVVLPLTNPDQSVLGFVVAGVSPRLSFDDEYKGFMDVLVGHVAAGVSSARAYEKEKHRAEAHLQMVRLQQEAGETLRKSEQRLRLALTSARMVAWEWQPADGSLHVSDNAAELFGLPHGPSLTAINHGLALIHPDDVGAYRETFSKAIDELRSYLIHYRLIRPNDGKVVWMEERGNAVRAGPNSAVRLFGVVTDITERKQAEREKLDLLKELEKQNAFINAVLTQVPAAIVVADADSGKIMMSNAEAHRIVRHDYTPGTRLEDYGNVYILEAFRPDGSRYQSGQWPLDRALRGESIMAEEIELVLRGLDRVTVRVNAGPIRVGQDIVAAVVAYHDITDRKVAEQSARFLADTSASLAELEDYEATLRRVAGLAVPRFADWVVVEVANETGPARRVAVAHADPSKVELVEELYHRFPRHALLDHGPCKILRTGLAEMAGDITDAMLIKSVRDEGRRKLLLELGVRSYIGVPLIVRGETLGVLSFVSGQSGRRYGDRDLAIAKDLAARAAIAIDNARLYARLKEADRRKDEFLATLAHELRNPLAPIRNGLQLLRLPSGDGATWEMARTMMERQLGQMVRLVDDLMDVSRINQGKLELRRDRLDLAMVLASAVETSRPLVEQMGHRLDVALPSQPIVIDADLTRLAQVFSNLLNNAAKYSERGGRITLTAEQQDDEVVIAVRDTGIGIAADQLPRLFEMFSQVKSALERSQGGLGIGLALVKRLVEMHGGRIEARSEGLGKGSEFLVRLPVVVCNSEPTSSIDRSEDGLRSALRILVVDDNRDGADSLSMMLRILGGETRTAYDGEEAVAAADAFRPDVIVLDIGLPKLNGYEACRRIRAHADGRKLVVIAQTGWGQDEDRQRTHEAGFDHHLVKPVDPAELMKLLAGLADAPRT